MGGTSHTDQTYEVRADVALTIACSELKGIGLEGFENELPVRIWTSSSRRQLLDAAGLRQDLRVSD
jgi:hypothetical protein